MNRSRQPQRGRPLLFLGAVALGWVGLRLAYGLAEQAVAPAPDRLAFMQQAEEVLSEDQPRALEHPLPEQEQAAGSVQSVQADTQPLVPELDAPPPPHLASDPVPLPTASAFNTMWMEASVPEERGTDPEPKPDADPALGDQPG